MPTRFIFGRAKDLPYFDNLVYRFVSDSTEAQSAVLAGECDLVDQTAGLETRTADLLQLRGQGAYPWCSRPPLPGMCWSLT